MPYSTDLVSTADSSTLLEIGPLDRFQVKNHEYVLSVYALFLQSGNNGSRDIIDGRRYIEEAIVER